MQLDFTALLPVAVMGVIGWLIRNTFKEWGTKLDGAVQEIRQIKDDHGNRLTALETVVEGWHPLRRKSDPPV